MSWRSNISNVSAGIGDGISLGLTKKLRRKINDGEVVDTDSKGYSSGNLAGTAASLLMPAGAGLKAGATGAKSLKSIKAFKASKAPKVKGTGKLTKAQHEKAMVRDQAKRKAANANQKGENNLRRHKAQKERRDTSPKGKAKRASHERAKASARKAEKQIKSSKGKPTPRSNETKKIIEQEVARSKKRALKSQPKSFIQYKRGIR